MNRTIGLIGSIGLLLILAVSAFAATQPTMDQHTVTNPLPVRLGQSGTSFESDPLPVGVTQSTTIQVVGLRMALPSATTFPVTVGASGGATRFIAPGTRWAVMTPGHPSATTCSDTVRVSLISVQDAFLNGDFANNCGHPWYAPLLSLPNGASVYLASGTGATLSATLNTSTRYDSQ
jgi:hypothetical protein